MAHRNSNAWESEIMIDWLIFYYALVNYGATDKTEIKNFGN